MKIYLDNNLGVTNVEQEELTQDTIGYNILKVYIPNAVLTPYNVFTCYYGALLQNGRKVGWFAMEARTNTDADFEENYTLYKATLEQCIVSVEGKVYIGCQVLLGNSGNATLIKKNTAVVQFNVRKSVAINNDILVLDTDQTTTDVLESYKNLLENALTTYATKATTYTKTEVDSALALKADKSNTYTKTEADNKFAPKTTAITHTGNQLQDENGNNIYPNLDAKTQAKIDNAYGPAYVGKDTSAHILAFTTNKGIYVGSDTGHWYYWNGSQYAEGGTYLSDVTNSIKPYPVGDYNDCNLVPVNSIITITISTPYSNTPSGESEGTLLTFNQYLLTSNSSGSGQIFISKNNKLYSRINWNGWKAWVSLSLDKNIMHTYNPSNYNNASLVPVNSIMTITGGYSNLPSGEREGTLLTFNQYQLYDGGIGSTQLFISKYNKFYTRLFWGSSWTGWVNLNGIENKNHYDDYIYAKYEFNNKTSLWCGDSIIHGETSGAVVVDDPVVDLFSNYCNMNYTNIAVGGAKIVGSASNNSILKQLTDTNLKDVDYLFIGAGVNDFLTNTSLTDVKNALIDIMDYIVNNFASKTKVFFITPINYYGTASGNNTLNNYRDIINETIMSYDSDRFNIIQGYKFNFPLYDNNAAFKSLMSNDGIHPTQLGYKTAYLRGLIKSLIL